jgi:NADPH:quinone reductase-like Zn-dependent oxidoreductase
VVGHSSGEIAAAYVAGYLTMEHAIIIAYYRGFSAKVCHVADSVSVGMLAVGLGADDAAQYIRSSGKHVEIACKNSPKSVTLSGTLEELEHVKAEVVKDGHFARMLQVDLAYHSKYMDAIGQDYFERIKDYGYDRDSRLDSPTMYSSVSGSQASGPLDAAYWKKNMVSPVQFNEAVQEMVSGTVAPDFLIEIGPTGALAGPIAQIKDFLGPKGSHLRYCQALKRGDDPLHAFYEVAGKLYINGGQISLDKVNEYAKDPSPSMIVDLPNYSWNHSNKYWHESKASEDWRFRPYLHHDLLGTKVLGTPWHSPSFRKTLRLEQLPWLRDHRMGDDVLMPASGYIAMAVEALYQAVQMTDPAQNMKNASELRYRLRDIRFEKAMVLEDDVDLKIIFTLSPNPGTHNPWYDFSVSSSSGDSLVKHCRGLIRIEPEPIHIQHDVAAPLEHSSAGSTWYKAQSDVGYGFGLQFQRVLEVESLRGQRDTRSIVSLEPAAALHSPQSSFPMHPVAIDGCFQTSSLALWAGDSSSVDGVLVPASIDSLVLGGYPTPQTGVSCARSYYAGRGRREDAQNYKADCTVYDAEQGRAILELTGLQTQRLDVGIASKQQHTLSQLSWRPDISQSPKALIDNLILTGDTALQQVIDLVAHENPEVNILEVYAGSEDLSSLWFDHPNDPSRLAYSRHVSWALDPKLFVDAQLKYAIFRDTTFTFLKDVNASETKKEDNFEFAILHLPFASTAFSGLARRVRGVLADGRPILIVETSPNSENGSITSFDTDLSTILGDAGFTDVVKLPESGGRHGYLAIAGRPTTTPLRPVTLVNFHPNSPPGNDLNDALTSKGWTVRKADAPFLNLDPNSVLIVLDESHSPFLRHISCEHWSTLQRFISEGFPILWVTEGSQMAVHTPDNAMVHGLFRTIRAEDYRATLVTVDVEHADAPPAYTAIEHALRSMLQKRSTHPFESEFVERAGVIYTSRVIPDAPLNHLNLGINSGTVEPKILRDVTGTARLRAERLGTFESLHYSQTSATDLPVPNGMIEVDIKAAGLNFKDIAVTMGIVPENEHLLGLEAGGVVRRVGSDAGGQFQVGDRVAILVNGTFANRIQCPVERAHRIPDFLSFEEAASIPLVYLTSMYSLFDVGGLSKGRSVLIHSAAGGIGIACIQLSQWCGADIYVTVGTEEKKRFLQKSFNIPPERIFSSRSKKFAADIRRITKGSGIDVIVNSLIGELLDESWRICADGGVMVEIGKKDILDRNYLSMEPFDRNCSFRAVDLSYKQITDQTIQRFVWFPDFVIAII